MLVSFFFTLKPFNYLLRGENAKNLWFLGGIFKEIREDLKF